MRSKIPSYLLHSEAHKLHDRHEGHRVGSAFLDRGLLGLSRVLKDTYIQWDLSRRVGFFQSLDPRVKLLFLAAFVVAISLEKDSVSELCIAPILLVLVLLSRLRIVPLYSRVLGFSLVFGILLSLPSAFNILVPGTVVIPLVNLERDYHVLVYHIPKTIGLTTEGLNHVALLSLRVANSLTICLLVLFTTPFPDLVKALGLFRVPQVIIMILTLFHKYLFILACSLEEMHLAVKSRLASTVRRQDARVWAAGRMAYLYRKSLLTCEEVFRAMLSRGFTGEIHPSVPRRLRGIDWVAGSALLTLWVLIIIF